MTTYPARVVEIPPRHDPDHHPPGSPLAPTEPEDPADEPGRTAPDQQRRPPGPERDA
jgi:hypothetical protein